MIIGALPFQSMIPELRNENVGGIVCCTEEFETKSLPTSMTKDAWESEQFKFHSVPMQDFTGTTSRQNIHSAVQFIEGIASEGKSVYVHCKAGRTRSATVAVSYLMKRNDWDPNVAFEHLKSKRPQVLLRINLSSHTSLANGDRVAELEYELERAYETIAIQKAKNSRLTHMQNVVDSEVQELTEKLFQEAYKMVNAAEERREKSEKLLIESRLKVDMLSAEVEVLKSVVKAPTQKASFSHVFMNSSSKTTPLRRVTGRAFKVAEETSASNSQTTHDIEIDPIYYREFAEWREDGMKLDFTSPFLARIIAEEVKPCLTFDNELLATSVITSIMNNTLELEPSHEKKTSVRTCALTNVQRHCPYKLRVSPDSDWVCITLLCRNRIASVCDFYTYVRYMNLGIVKTGLNDSYWDVIHHRRNMTLAKCGLGYGSKTNSGFSSVSE
ncbi:hypothetical protein QR680_000081 [Steinernema hermaphroditum]|uniref:Tyrosine specific protein phosphatases domain-containing protein n=1 Tax=Steinernema hermaphroditum TaxID=289476 RepID=A0AA39GT90_9BILA|nr:hypothetical protein QR680_000081 [Steinernema hermaphroditum]